VTIKPAHAAGRRRYDHPWSWFPAVTQPKSTFFPGADFARADGVTGYNDITPRFGAAYDVFGNGKTALKLSVGKYLQGRQRRQSSCQMRTHHSGFRAAPPRRSATRT
jgi:hypothetical protein